MGVEQRAAFLCCYVENSSVLMMSFNMEQLYRRRYCPECADKNTEVPGGEAEPALRAKFSDPGVSVILSISPHSPTCGINS